MSENMCTVNNDHIRPTLEDIRENLIRTTILAEIRVNNNVTLGTIANSINTRIAQEPLKDVGLALISFDDIRDVIDALVRENRVLKSGPPNDLRISRSQYNNFSGHS